jgi:hypothetical protein
MRGPDISVGATAMRASRDGVDRGPHRQRLRSKKAASALSMEYNDQTKNGRRANDPRGSLVPRPESVLWDGELLFLYHVRNVQVHALSDE